MGLSRTLRTCVFNRQMEPASGRKRTLIPVVFGVPERPLWRKADIPEYPQDFHNFDQLGTSAFRPEADIKLILVKRSANDPKPTSTDERLQYGKKRKRAVEAA